MTYANHTDFALIPAQDVAPRAARTDALSTIRLFNIDVVSASTETVITRLLEPGRRSRVAFLNAHCGNVMAHDADYADALATADMVLPDGIGVELAARMTGERFVANLNGTDFTPALLRRAAAKGLSVFLLGARPGVAEDAALHPRICLGVGALFDFLAGRVRRAPDWVRRAKSEWMWRLAMEPRRMARRYLIGNATFMARAAVSALRQGQDQGQNRGVGSLNVSRVMDVALAGGSLLALAPAALLVAAAIKLESPGPVFFRQTRVGKDGRQFSMLKFRSMHVDAEARRAALLASSDREGVCFKSRNDPRVTRIGRVLRRFSIDEMPQIWNVLRGDMALVGPRPALPSEVAQYPARALERLACKPGLTGIWQVSGRAEIGFDKMIDMDVAYVRSRSTLLDVILIAMTFKAVLGGRGAY